MRASPQSIQSPKYPIELWIFLVLLTIGAVAASLGKFLHDRSRRAADQAKEKATHLTVQELGTNEYIFGIRIIGSNVFRLLVAQSLKLLELAATPEFVFVTNNIKVIVEDIRSGISVEADPPVLHFAAKTIGYSLTWCASTLSHEAYHVFLYKAGRSREMKTHFQAVERECLNYQYNVMKKIGASRYELDHIRSSNGMHPDVNGDGRFDWDDYYSHYW